MCHTKERRYCLGLVDISVSRGQYCRSPYVKLHPNGNQKLSYAIHLALLLVYHVVNAIKSLIEVDKNDDGPMFSYSTHVKYAT